jgi:hypothetical protein
MMSRRIGWAGWIVAVFAVAACGDSTGVARDYDPFVTANQFDDVLGAVAGNEDLLLSLDLAVVTLEWYDADGLAAAVALRAEAGDGLMAAVDARRQRRTGIALEGAASADVYGASETGRLTPGAVSPLYIPSAIRGRTLVWDPVEGYVPVSDPTAPVDGVRVVLYAMNPYDGYPSDPLSEIGVLDILDEDHSGGEQVRIYAVRTSGPDRVIADYFVEMAASGTAAQGELLLNAEGRFGDATAVDLDLSEERSWSQAGDRDELRMDYIVRRGGQSLRVAGIARADFEAYEWRTFDFDVAVRGGGPNVDIEAQIRSDDSLWGEIRADGRLAIRIGGYDGRPSFERPEGTLSYDELDALDAVWTGISDLVWYADWLLVPQELLWLDG